MKLTAAAGITCPIPPGLPQPSVNLELSHDDMRKLAYIMHFVGTIPRALTDEGYCDMYGREAITSFFIDFKSLLDRHNYRREHDAFAGGHMREFF